MERKQREWMLWRVCTPAFYKGSLEEHDKWLGEFVEGGDEFSDPPRDLLLAFDGPAVGTYERFAAISRVMKAISEDLDWMNQFVRAHVTRRNTTHRSGMRMCWYGVYTTHSRNGVWIRPAFRMTPPITLFAVGQNEPRGRHILAWYQHELYQRSRQVMIGSPRAPLQNDVIGGFSEETLDASDPLHMRFQVALDSFLERGRADERFLEVEA